MCFRKRGRCYWDLDGQFSHGQGQTSRAAAGIQIERRTLGIVRPASFQSSIAGINTRKLQLPLTHVALHPSLVRGYDRPIRRRHAALVEGRQLVSSSQNFFARNAPGQIDAHGRTRQHERVGIPVRRGRVGILILVSGGGGWTFPARAAREVVVCAMMTRRCAGLRRATRSGFGHYRGAAADALGPRRRGLHHVSKWPSRDTY